MRYMRHTRPLEFLGSCSKNIMRLRHGLKSMLSDPVNASLEVAGSPALDGQEGRKCGPPLPSSLQLHHKACPLLSPHSVPPDPVAWSEWTPLATNECQHRLLDRGDGSTGHGRGGEGSPESVKCGASTERVATCEFAEIPADIAVKPQVPPPPPPTCET